MKSNMWILTLSQLWPIWHADTQPCIVQWSCNPYLERLWSEPYLSFDHANLGQPPSTRLLVISPGIYLAARTHKNTQKVIFTALLKRMVAKIINCIRKQQQNSLMCGNIIHVSNSRYFWVKTNKNGKEWALGIPLFHIPEFHSVAFLPLHN